MIIKEIRIKNFRSYYGDNNHFEFSDGLTLILGDNGDGKTTFFEALQWLFNTTIDSGSMDNVSEMRKSKLEIGESDEVSVYMAFEHNGEKSVEKVGTPGRNGIPRRQICIADAFLRILPVRENVVGDAVAVSAVLFVRFFNGLLRPLEEQSNDTLILQGITSSCLSIL